MRARCNLAFVVAILGSFTVTFSATWGPAHVLAQEATPAVVVPEDSPQPGMSRGWTNFKGDAGRSGRADSGPTGQPVELWRVQAGGACNPPPAVVDGVVYAACDDDNLYALDAETGVALWTVAGSGFGDPIVAADLVYVPDEAGLHAIETATGVERWQVATAVSGGAVVDGGLLVFGSEDGLLIGLDAASGVEQWRYQITTEGAVHNPAIGGGIAYAGSDESGFFAVDAASGTLLWRGDTGDDETATAVVADGIAYLGASGGNDEGQLHAFDAETGAALWSRDEPIFTPAVLDGVGYSGSGIGVVYAFDTATGEERWRVQLGGTVLPVAVAPGVVYAPSDGDRAVFALDAATGQQLWSFSLDGGIDGSVAVDGGVAYVTTKSGSIYAIGGTDQGAVAAGTTVPIASQGATPAEAATAEPASPVAPAAEAPAEVVWQSTGGPEPLVWAELLGLDPQGNLWIADSPSRFQIVSPEGTFVETWGTPGDGDGEFAFKDPEGDAYWGSVAFDAVGNLYVTDYANARVQKFGPDRSFLLSWGSRGDADGQFLAPIDVVVDKSGIVFVVDAARHDVQAFDADGTFLFSFGGFGSAEGQLNVPWGMAVGPDGLVWVADYENRRVQAFGPDGAFATSIGNLIAPNDVAIDEEGRVYVAEQEESRIRVFTPDGNELVTFGAFGPDPGEFVCLTGVAVDDRGAVYASDCDLKRVQKFRLPVLAAAGTPTP